MNKSYDIAIVGAGIVGLGTALAAMRMGKKVIVIERSPHAIGASIRNFGFVTVTGQRAGAHYQRALRSREIWAEIAAEVGFDIIHSGLVIPAYRDEAAHVVESFLKTDMGQSCTLITVDQALQYVPALKTKGIKNILYSPHELRVESALVIPQLAKWLHKKHDVNFFWNTSVYAINGNTLQTTQGVISAETVIACPGNDFSTLYPERIAVHNLSICTLQMLRVAPERIFKQKAAIMSDLSLARYEGFSALPEARGLAERLDKEESEKRAAGIHLIAVQSADGSLVVGDSHVYGHSPQPFASDHVDNMILEALDDVFDIPKRKIVKRWIGDYAYSADKTVLIDRPEPNVRLVVVTGGTGASTAFALGEEVLNELYNI
ncbi:TIGR03364 family FAD-dependent oxidoreductase [Bartonella tamiae]|uniref:FAD dependent oxidoreductase n=1 Tax=Bartonella tamiae Th239 TaxID=1094558 RepID=J1JWP2_9HYPH|nr:TIGR03364 family FAD-dependent oxidoreductase [Bartonella tamiae]EJF89005.1 FAD dependent oxidoreductase [Bartonella tamiae Th239]EJF94745.1 FAD dependent oxidoreductase [Bartonella tamiae Th307]